MAVNEKRHRGSWTHFSQRRTSLFGLYHYPEQPAELQGVISTLRDALAGGGDVSQWVGHGTVQDSVSRWGTGQSTFPRHPPCLSPRVGVGIALPRSRRSEAEEGVAEGPP